MACDLIPLLDACQEARCSPSQGRRACQWGDIAAVQRQGVWYVEASALEHLQNLAAKRRARRRREIKDGAIRPPCGGRVNNCSDGGY